MDGLTAPDNLSGPDPGATLDTIFHLLSGGRDLECFGPFSPLRWQIMSVNAEDSSLQGFVSEARRDLTVQLKHYSPEVSESGGNLERGPAAVTHTKLLLLHRDLFCFCTYQNSGKPCKNSMSGFPRSPAAT